MAAVPLVRLALVVAVYLSLDLSNPMMPGALTFGVEDSVEARQADRFRSHGDAAGLPASPSPARAGAAARIAAAPRLPALDVPRRGAFPIRRAHPPSSPSPAVPGDH